MSSLMVCAPIDANVKSNDWRMGTPRRHRWRTTSRSKSVLKVRDRLPYISFLILIVTVIRFCNQGISLQTSAMTTASPVFSLLVTAQFDSVEHKLEMLGHFKAVAEHVKSHEPTTLAYEVLLSDKDPNQVMVLERYQDKENAFLKVHRSSAPFLEFRQKLQAMQDKGFVTLSGHSYLDSGVGFTDRTAS